MPLDLEALTKPVAEDNFCGPDLELEGDMDYMNFLAGAEGMLPASYFGKDASGNDDRPFDRTSIDFAAQFKIAEGFLEKTRDLRLLSLLAKFSILNRDLSGFITSVRAIEKLLEEHWQDVHPRGEDGDFGLRMVAIEALDASPTVIMPLQFMPLIEHKRYGSFSQRAYLLAKGDQQPRGEEEPADLATVDRILQETELPLLIEKRDQLRDLDTTLKQMRTIWQDNSSGPPVSFERLPAALGQIVGILDGVIVQRDPSAVPSASPGDDAATADTEAGAVRAVGKVGSAADAASALATVADYFSRREPSNPALLLIRQAHALLGKSFLDVMRVLIPDQVGSAAFNIGREQVFDLPVERLAEFATPNGEIVASAPPAEEPEATPEQTEPAPEEPEAAPEEPAADPNAEAQTEPVAEGNGADARPVAHIAVQRLPPLYSTETRAQALGLLDQVGAYLRGAEPSSPIPFLVDRARDLAQRDFLSLLKALLPAGTLREPEPR